MNHDTAALSDLRHFLRCWRRWIRGWRPNLGYPPEVPWLRLIKATTLGIGNADDYADEFWAQSEEVDDYILRTVDAVVESLQPLNRAAVRMVYLREIGPAVLRTGRMSMAEASLLCDAAETQMVPALRAKGIVLGGK